MKYLLRCTGILLLIGSVSLSENSLIGQTKRDSTPSSRFVPNYDESKVPHYVLPDPLVFASGEVVKDANDWNTARRVETLNLFSNHVFGKCPPPIPVTARLISSTDQACGGKATRREIELTLSRNEKKLMIDLLIYTPRGKTKSPIFLGLNFDGNHALEDDPNLRITPSWMRETKDETVESNRATEKGRGKSAAAWPVERIVDRGFGLATIYYGDIDPDFDDGFQNGIHGLFADWNATIPADERWGSIAGWAYGLSRALDYLEQDSLVDANRVAVIGHSRLGKTALWAAASDTRFKMAISNNSGCGGAALSRRAFGETVGQINRSFPHWFCQKHRQYNENEAALPIDHHQLIALIAPRPVYVASASEDLWADPRGEYLACVHADPVYRLLKTPGLGGTKPRMEMPAPDVSIQEGVIGYHLRTGAHALTAEDWKHYLDFADKCLR